MFPVADICEAWRVIARQEMASKGTHHSSGVRVGCLDRPLTVMIDRSARRRHLILSDSWDGFAPLQ